MSLRHYRFARIGIEFTLDKIIIIIFVLQSLNIDILFI